MKVKPDAADDPVLIGELAALTGATRRALRYYEEQHLLVPDRDRNGYRRYPRSSVVRVHQIRGLLDAGFSSDIIGRLLPCTVGVPPSVDLCPSVVAEMRTVLDAVESQLGELDRRRRSIRALLGE